MLWQPFSPFQMQVCKEKTAICRNLIHCQIGYLRSQRNCSEIHLFYLHGMMFKHKGDFTLLICQLKSLVWLFHIVFGGIIVLHLLTVSLSCMSIFPLLKTTSIQLPSSSLYILYLNWHLINLCICIHLCICMRAVI